LGGSDDRRKRAQSDTRPSEERTLKGRTRAVLRRWSARDAAPGDRANATMAGRWIAALKKYFPHRPPPSVIHTAQPPLRSALLTMTTIAYSFPLRTCRPRGCRASLRIQTPVDWFAYQGLGSIAARCQKSPLGPYYAAELANADGGGPWVAVRPRRAVAVYFYRARREKTWTTGRMLEGHVERRTLVLEASLRT